VIARLLPVVNDGGSGAERSDELHWTNGAQRRRMPTTLRSVLVGEVVGNVLNGLERLKDRVVIGGLFVAAK
jgi:hypothetical protein